MKILAESIAELIRHGQATVPKFCYTAFYWGAVGTWGSQLLIIVVYVASWLLDPGATRQELLDLLRILQ